MKKIIFIVFLFPCILLAQDTQVMTTQDAVINAVLENTLNYIAEKQEVDPTENLEVNPKEDSIDWNNKGLIKWQIIEPKDSLKTTDKDFKTID